MKKTTLVLFLMLCAALAADAALSAESDSSGGVRVSAGVDLLGLKNYRVSDWARQAPGPMKIIAYPLDYAGYMIGEHPVQSLLIALLIAESAGITEITPINKWFGSEDNDTTTHITRDNSLNFNINTRDYSPVTISLTLPEAPEALE